MRTNSQGRESQKAGMQFAYTITIRVFERKRVIAFDELLRQTDAKLVKMEMDIGWVAARAMIRAIFEKYRTFELLHVKDIRPAPSTEGEGRVQLNRPRHNRLEESLAAARRASIKHYFVEQEDPFLNMPVMEASK